MMRRTRPSSLDWPESVLDRIDGPAAQTITAARRSSERARSRSHTRYVDGLHARADGRWRHLTNATFTFRRGASTVPFKSPSASARSASDRPRSRAGTSSESRLPLGKDRLLWRSFIKCSASNKEEGGRKNDQEVVLILPPSTFFLPPAGYRATAAIAPVAAFSMIAATACGCDTYTEWLPLTSVTIDPARIDIAR